jgi:hypothetical protein
MTNISQNSQPIGLTNIENAMDGIPPSNTNSTARKRKCFTLKHILCILGGIISISILTLCIQLYENDYFRDYYSNPVTVSIKPYPGYHGHLDVSGRVRIYRSGIGNVFKYRFYGLEKSESGGWHVHDGTSCNDPQGHYTNGLSEDPWTNVFWVSNKHRKSRGTVQMKDIPLNVHGRTLVVHDSNGVRVGCGEIPGTPNTDPTQQPTSAPTPAPSPRPTPPETTCQDDTARLTNYSGFTCQQIFQEWEFPCNVPFSDMIPSGDHITGNAVCPMSCGYCQSHDGHCEDDDSALMEAAHLCELLTNPAFDHNNHRARKRCERSARYTGLFQFAPRRILLSDICPATCEQCGCVDDIEPLALELGGCSGFLATNPDITCETEFEFLEEQDTPSPFNTSNSVLLQKATEAFAQVTPQKGRSFQLNDFCKNTCDNCPSHNPNCADDNKALAVYLGRCSGALERTPLNCESALTDVSPFATEGYLLKDFCPNRCGTCNNYPTSFPTLIPSRRRRRR